MRRVTMYAAGRPRCRDQRRPPDLAGADRTASVTQDFDTFDLGIGDASYKNKWATHHLALQSHERAVTAAGRIYLQMQRVCRFVSASGIRTWFKTAS
jgi:hypothetical protein